MSNETCETCGAEMCAHGLCSAFCDFCETKPSDLARLRDENARLRGLLVRWYMGGSLDRNEVMQAVGGEFARHELAWVPVAHGGLWKCIKCDKHYCSPPWSHAEIMQGEVCAAAKGAET